MKQKILYIILGVFAVVILINVIKTIVHETEYGTKAEIKVPMVSCSDSDSIKKVIFMIDNSGSMRGYVDFSGNSPQFDSARSALLAKTGDFMGRCENKLSAQTEALCNGNSYNTSATMRKLGNYTAFSGAITEVEKMISQAIDKSNDSTLTVIVSDMILSYGLKVLKNMKDDKYNYRKLEDLKVDIRNQFYRLKNEGMGILIAKYEADFNGKYYYNHTENITPSGFKDSLMKKRPFYFVVIGKTQRIKELCNNNCLPEDYKAIFSSLCLENHDLICKDYQVTQPNNQASWILGNPDGKQQTEAAKRTYTISTNKNFKEAKFSFNFSFDPPKIPTYVSDSLSVVHDKNYLSNVSISANRDTITVQTCPFEQLPKGTTTLKVECTSPRHRYYQSSSTLDDVTCSLKDMEGKTWGFEAVVKALYEAYDIKKGDFNKVISLEFNIIKE